MAEDEPLRPAEDQEVISSIVHGLRFSRGRRTADEDDILARTAAARVLEHLRGSFVILRKPMGRRRSKS